MHYYTYAYLREDRTPYYIGKGKEDRIYSKQKNIKPPKDKSRILYLKQNLTEEEAFKHEIYMIDVFGRKDLGTGILHNLTNGGDGASGCIHSPETKAKMSAAHKGKKNHNYGKTLSKNTKDKKSKSMKGKSIHTKKSKKNISTKLKGKTSPMKGKTNPNSGKKTNYKLYQYDLKGNLLNTFNSPQEAFEQTGVNKRSILNVINPNQYSKTCYGFIWSKNILT